MLFWRAEIALGIWGGSSLVCGYALLTRVDRDRFIPTSSIAGNRLADPIGSRRSAIRSMTRGSNTHTV